MPELPAPRRIAVFATVLVVTALLVWTEPPAVGLWPPVAALLIIAATRRALVGLLAGGLLAAGLVIGYLRVLHTGLCNKGNAAPRSILGFVEGEGQEAAAAPEAPAADA